MPIIFPACMMPDGAEPCEAFQKLQAEAERLRAENADLKHERDALKNILQREYNRQQ